MKRVRVKRGHWKGRTGVIVRADHLTAVVDIGEPLYVRVPLSNLEPAPDDPAPDGWEEVDV